MGCLYVRTLVLVDHHRWPQYTILATDADGVRLMTQEGENLHLRQVGKVVGAVKVESLVYICDTDERPLLSSGE